MERYLNVPTLDISPLFGDCTPAKQTLAREIETVCKDHGFFYVSNHGLDLEKLQEATMAFHHRISDAEKWDLAIQAYNPSNLRRRSGYYMALKGKKANESFCYLNPNFTERHPRIASPTPLHEVNVWPEESQHPGWRAYCEDYYWGVFRVTAALLRGFAIALGKEEHFFDPYFTPNDTLSAVSLIRYPYLENYPPVKTGADGTQLSFEAHEDVSLITVLYQTPIPNLQAETSAGYSDLPTSADCLLVNCGTYMAHITNNHFRAPIHRVKFVNAERLSIPFFAHFSHSSVIEPFTPHQTHVPSQRKGIVYGEYLASGLQTLIISNGQT